MNICLLKIYKNTRENEHLFVYENNIVYFLALIVPNNESSTATTIAKITAFQNHPTLNPSRKLLASIIIKTVIIHPTNHSVIQFSGKVRIRRIVHSVLLSNAITTATIRARRKLATSTPGIRYAAIATAAPMSINCIIRFIMKKTIKDF